MYKRDSFVATLRYSEIHPGLPLADAIRCIWTAEGVAAGAPPPDPVVPDGCVELVLNLGDPFEQLVNGSFARQPLAMLIGQSTRPAIIRPSGRVDLIGVRLHPWAARRLLRIPAGEVRDRLLPMDDVPTAVDPSLFDAIASVSTPASRMTLLTRHLERALSSSRETDRAHRSLVRLVLSPAGPSSVKDLARRTGRGMRAIQRTFEHEIGLAPKALMRIARVQRALRLARTLPELSWASIGARAGYFDQSHLVREFRDLVGCVPTEFRAPADSLTHALLQRSEEELM